MLGGGGWTISSPLRILHEVKHHTAWSGPAQASSHPPPKVLHCLQGCQGAHHKEDAHGHTPKKEGPLLATGLPTAPLFPSVWSLFNGPSGAFAPIPQFGVDFFGKLPPKICVRILATRGQGITRNRAILPGALSNANFPNCVLQVPRQKWHLPCNIGVIFFLNFAVFRSGVCITTNCLFCIAV